MQKKSQKPYLTNYNFLIAQDLWQYCYQILLIFLLKKFIKLNANVSMIIKNAKRVKLNRRMDGQCHKSLLQTDLKMVEETCRFNEDFVKLPLQIYPFLYQRTKIEKLEKLVANLPGKKEKVIIYIRN